MKYYRIAAWQKDENTKELILRVDSKEEAISQIDNAKKFLYPGEDTSTYRAFVQRFTLTMNIGTEVPHYRITVFRPTQEKKEDIDNDWMDLEAKSYELIEQAKTEDEAKEKMQEILRSENKDPKQYHIYADEMALEECIKEEEDRVHRIVRSVYGMHLCSDMTIKEFSKISRELDERGDLYYQALKYFCNLHYTRNFLSRTEDLPAMKICESERLLKELTNAIGREDYQQILDKAINKQ